VVQIGDAQFQVVIAIDSKVFSQYDYVNDGGGRRTSVKYSGTAFDVGSSFNLYGYNNRSEVISGDKYWGANLNDTSDPVTGQGFAYAYDNIGNRTGASRDNEEVSYTANSLNAYSLRTVSDLIDIIGSAETGTTFTVNSLAVNRHSKYWHKGLGVTNDTASVYQPVNVVGVYNPPGTNDPDIVTTETGHVFVAKTPETFTYDDDGNLLSDGRFNYSWDGENRLVAAETLSTLPSSVPRVKVEFEYDYMSRRVSKQVSNIVSGQWTVVSGHSFVYDSWNLVSEICNQQSEITTNLYIHGLDMSGSLGGAGGIGGLLAAKLGTNSVCYTYDANGNVSELLAADCSLAAHYEYSPFGETIVATGPLASENKFRFSTKFTDDETTLLYYGYRYYSPSLGRWLSRDPIGELGGHNLYAILKNGPIDKQDAIGLLDCGAIEAAKAALRAAETDIRALFATVREAQRALLNPQISAIDRATYQQVIRNALASVPAARAALEAAKAALTAASATPVGRCCCIAFTAGSLCGYAAGNIPTGDDQNVWDWVAEHVWEPVIDWWTGTDTNQGGQSPTGGQSPQSPIPPVPTPDTPKLP